MAIVVDHSRPAPAGLISGIGQSLSAAKQGPQDEERLRWLLGYRQREKEVDVNAALRVRGQDIEQQQYQQNLARQNAAQQSLLANQEANRQAQLYSQQMREEYDMAQQQQEQMFQYAVDSVKTVDQQVTDTVKASQQMKLNPEGQRILNEMMGKLREVREHQDTTRPGVYSSLMNQWLDKYNSLGLDAYEVKEPSATEKVYNNLVPLQGQRIEPGQPLPPGTYRSLKGVRNGVESWETITISEPPAATFAEEVEKNRAPAPDGGFFYRQPDGKVTHVPPPTPPKAEKPKEPDFDKYIAQSQAELESAHATANAGKKDAPAYVPDEQKILERAQMKAQLAVKLAAQLAKKSDLPMFSESAMLPMGGGIAGGLGNMMMDAVTIDSQEEYDALPSGATYIDAQTGARGSKP